MIMLKKRHEEILEKENNIYYQKGLKEGRINATKEIEAGFELQLKNYNELNVQRIVENSRLAVQNVNLKKEIEDKNKSLNELFEYSKSLESRVHRYEFESLEKEKKIEILKFFLRCNYNKEVARYEQIAKRTKKVRIREKAEKKIIEFKELELAFE